MTEPADTDDDARDDKRRAKDAGLYLYSRLMASILALVAIGIATRMYSKLEFAYVATILLLYETAYALGSLGLPEAVFFFVGHDAKRAPLVVRQASYLLLLVTIPVLVIVTAAGVLISKPDVDVIPALPWLALALLFAMPTQPAINQLLATGRARAASVLHTTFAALQAVAIVIPIITGLSASLIPMFLAAATSVRLIVHMYLLRRLFPIEEGAPWRVRDDLRAMMKFAAPAGLAALCGKLNVQIDKYVVKLMLTTQVFAYYTAASYELPLISMIPYAVGAVMQVKYVQLHVAGRTHALHKLWTKNVIKTSLIVFPVTMLVIAVAPEIVELLFGRDFLPATLPFQLFTAVLLHRVASYGAMLQATNQTRALLVSSVLLVGTNLILTVPLTWLLGDPGAALATLLANIPPWLWTLSRIASAMKVPLREVMPWPTLARNIALTGGLALAVWFAKDYVPGGAGARLVLAAGAYGIAYIILGRITRVLHRDDLTYISRWLSFRLR